MGRNSDRISARYVWACCGSVVIADDLMARFKHLLDRPGQRGYYRALKRKNRYERRKLRREEDES